MSIELDQNTLFIICIFLLLILAILSVVILKKIHRLHLFCFQLRDQSKKLAGDLYQQLQHLRILETELQFTQPLPPTRGWAASPDFLRLVAAHAREHKPKIAVECSSGVSTLILARCMELNGVGHTYSLEHDPEFAAITRKNLDKLGLSKWATVVDAPMKSQVIEGNQRNWYSIDGLPDGEIDLIVVDGPPEPFGEMIRYPAGPMLFGKLSNSGTVFVDDADRDDETKAVALWQKSNPDLERKSHYCEKGCVVLSKTNG